MRIRIHDRHFFLCHFPHSERQPLKTFRLKWIGGDGRTAQALLISNTSNESRRVIIARLLAGQLLGIEDPLSP